MPVERTFGFFGFNCSGANPLLCQRSKHEKRTQWDWFLPPDSEEMSFPADRARVPFLLLDDLEQPFGRPCHSFSLLQNTFAISNIPVILWWFTCCRITGDTLRNPAKRDIYPPMEDPAWLSSVMMFAGEESFFASWGGGLSVKNHQQTGLELPLTKLSHLQEGQKDLLVL